MSDNRESGWLVIVIVAVIILSFFFMWRFDGGHMTGMMDYYGTGYMFIIPLALGLIAVGIYYFVTSSRTGRYSDRDGRALAILKERYAKGEISREQFLKMREELKS